MKVRTSLARVGFERHGTATHVAWRNETFTRTTVADARYMSLSRCVEILNDGWRLVGDLTAPVSATERRTPGVLMLNGADGMVVTTDTRIAHLM
jgi:hypothetical protein